MAPKAPDIKKKADVEVACSPTVGNEEEAFQKCVAARKAQRPRTKWHKLSCLPSPLLLRCLHLGSRS